MRTFQGKLGVLALSALLVAGTSIATGCSGTTVAQDIVNWTPPLQSAVATVDSTIALLDPAAAPALVAATVGFDAASNLLVQQAKTYLANPTAPVLAQLQTQVLAFQGNVATALKAIPTASLSGAQLQTVLGAINGVSTIVVAILALVASISNPAAKAQLKSAVLVSQLDLWRDDKQTAARVVAAHYQEPLWVATIQARAVATGLGRS